MNSLVLESPYPRILTVMLKSQLNAEVNHCNCHRDRSEIILRKEQHNLTTQDHQYL